MRRLIAIAVFQLASSGAYACLWATSTPPEGWYQWSAQLFGGDVTAVSKDESRPVDVITVKVVETFKGPETPHGGTLTVRVPSRNWAACKLELPATGARVLVALNANSEVLLVPLSASYTEQLRKIRGQGQN
jgi:hypothetical protein